MEEETEPPPPDGMTHADFHIGIEFFCAGSTWRSTDIGTRTVIAIRVDQVEVGSSSGGVRALIRSEAEREGWFTGPPYAVSERIFDEGDLGGCTIAVPQEHRGRKPAQSDLSHTDGDSLVRALARRLGIDDYEEAVRIAITGYLRQLDDGETLSQRVDRIQDQARNSGIGKGLTDHKALMDDMWGET